MNKIVDIGASARADQRRAREDDDAAAGDRMSLAVRHERPSQRMHQRVSAPLHVTVDGRAHTAADWSLGGLRITDFDRAAEPGDRKTLRLSIPFQGFDVGFGAEAEVVRCDPAKGELALRFVDLSDRARELMTHFLDELVRGSMSSAQDVIRRIDTPVTPTDTERLRDEARKLPLRRQRIRSIVIGSLYIVFGAATLGYLVFAIYANLFRLEVQSAVLAAPMQTLAAPADGRLVEVAVGEQEIATPGGELVILDDPSLAERIAQAEVAVDEVRSRVTMLEGMLEWAKIEGQAYRKIALNERASQRETVTALTEQLRNADADLVRTQTLVSKGAGSEQQLDEARSRRAELEAQLAQAKIKLAQHEDLLTFTELGMYFNADRFVGASGTLRPELAAARREVEFAERHLGALLRRQAAMVVTAPGEGRVKRVFKAPGSTVAKGEPLILFERTNEPRQIHAFLTQGEVLDVAKGDTARVYFPATGDRYDAKVIVIDRSGGAIDTTTARYSWNSEKDRNALVVLDVPQLNEAATRRKLDAGVPAVVVFQRTFNSALLSELFDWRSPNRAMIPPIDAAEPGS